MLHRYEQKMLIALLARVGTVAVLNEIVAIRAEQGKDNALLGRHVEQLTNAVLVVDGHEVPLVSERAKSRRVRFRAVG